MLYVDIEFIRRSPWWPVEHRPVPDSSLVALAAETHLLTPVIVRRLRRSSSFNPEYEIVDNEESWAVAQGARIDQIPTVIVDFNDADAERWVKARFAAAHPDRVGTVLSVSDVEITGPVSVARRYAMALADFARQPAQPRRRRGRRQTLSLVAREFGTSPALVRQHLNLLLLPVDIQRDVEYGLIAFGAARLMHSLSGAGQRELGRLIKERGYSVRDVEFWIREQREGRGVPDIVKQRDPDVKRLERLLSGRTGAIVKVAPGKSGAGQLIIHYESAEHLEGIMERPLRPRGELD